ncbi:MAG: nucleoside-diphosphate sugar epimerase/dehydratase [Opitutaceae bacterium]|nr:nucleoside-diphosphate sugar epimerase/dehydratase [Opitutaceae bacterium]
MSTTSKTSWAAVEMGRIKRTVVLLMAYGFILSACRYVSYEVRFDFLVPPEFQDERVLSLAFAIPIKILFLLIFRQFGTLLTYFSVPDLLRITAAMGCASITAYLIRFVGSPSMIPPRGVLLVDFVLSVAALATMRLAFRIYRERYGNGHKSTGEKSARRIVILGAGDAGAQLAGEALSKPSLGLRPVFFLDDNQGKHGHLIHGIPVLGRPEDIAQVRKDYPVDDCVLAMPSAPGRRLQEIYRLMSAEDLKVEIVPSLEELATGRVRVSKIRPVDVVDLLGRESVDLNNVEIGRMISDRIVLVTGAGGSIGSELCRQILTHNPQRLLMVEQAEFSLFAIESELNAHGYQNTIVPLIADILDLPRMRFILERFKPEVIFHAAAHKHVYMMERQPAEALKNNTTGTRQLAELAGEMGVGTFVMISTDKAINPTSVMGASKRLAEIFLKALHTRFGERTRFIAVRFGNVLGSSGSVIPIFKKQIAEGGPVTVTHPEVTRYFMTIPEAVGLVLQTSVLGKGGEIFVLDMGEPVKIVDLARQLIELSGFRPNEDIEIKFIGLRPGEKLFEELQHTSEHLKPTSHPRILLFESSPPDPKWVEASIREIDGHIGDLEANQVKLAIKKLVPEYSPHLD